MKITIYELLGMVKDGKIPEKIKYDGKLYEFDDTKDNYYENDTCSINWDYVAIYCLNEQVEILEEEKKIPEKITMRAGMLGSINNKLENLNINTMAVEDKINEIIDYLKSKGDE